MRVLIIFFSILAPSAITVALKSYGITIGAIPTILIYIPFFFLCPIIINKYSKDKIQSKKSKMNHSKVELHKDGSWRCPVCNTDNLYTKICENCDFEPVLIPEKEENRK